MFSKLKQFKDLKKRAQDLQTTLAQETADGTAGWGKVKVTMNGNQQVTNVVLDQEVMAEREKLQEYIKEATNDAMQKIQRIMATKLRDMGGMDLAKDFNEALGKKE